MQLTYDAIRVKLKRIPKRFVLLLATIAVMELLLRFVGVHPLGGSRNQGRPQTVEEDAELGWKLKPGRFKLIADHGAVHEETIWEGGYRATGRKESSGNDVKRPRLCFFGCSFMFGFGLNDNETLPWIVQADHPQFQVVNHGVGAYGTFQCLLVMEEIVSQQRNRRVTFIYGFSDFHEQRNVADPRNHRQWVVHSRTGDLRIPYCVMNEAGALVRIPPKGYPQLPLRSYSSLVSIIEHCYVTVSGQHRLKQKGKVTEKLLLEMRDVAQRNTSHFVVLLQDFQADNRSHYLEFFKRNGIETINALDSNERSPDMRLPDGHPNSSLNKYWAGRVKEYLSEHPNLADAIDSDR